MVRTAQEKVLLIGDAHRQVHAAILTALPTSTVTPVDDYFDGIAELSSGSYTAVLAAAEPVERRPEPAIRTLRQLCDGRLVLFGQPSLEGLSRRMLDFGVDDYLITPANPSEILQVFGTPLMRVTIPVDEDGSASGAATDSLARASAAANLLRGLPLAEVLLDALLQNPADAPQSAVKRIGDLIAPSMRLIWQPGDKPAAPPQVESGLVLSHAVRRGEEIAGQLHLVASRDEDPDHARHFLAQVAFLVGKMTTLQDRHDRLQKLAITDQLTGVYNRRYFEHFLTRILERARIMRFPVTLLLFDIDNFKRYNDTFGHGAGDEILRETATLMKRCCREHDLVARIGGDEFAVVFWEKEGPRLPKEQDPNRPPLPSKPPQTPQQVFDRFKRLMATQDFPGLGASGKGVLTISGGLASFPWDARDANDLVLAADRALVKGAKQGGKDRLYLVGEEDEKR